MLTLPFALTLSRHLWLFHKTIHMRTNHLCCTMVVIMISLRNEQSFLRTCCTVTYHWQEMFKVTWILFFVRFKFIKIYFCSFFTENSCRMRSSIQLWTGIMLPLYVLQYVGVTRAADPKFDPTTRMRLVLVPADAQVGSVIYRLRASDEEFDYPLTFELVGKFLWLCFISIYDFNYVLCCFFFFE